MYFYQNQIIVPRFLTQIAIHVNHTDTEFFTQQSDDFPLVILIVRSIVGLIGNLSFFLYCCLAIGFLCDKHFVPNLNRLGDSLSLSQEISASILIPFGTSGPEIFSSIVGILFTDNDIGTGAIIGSSCYNQLAIPAACGLTVAYFVGQPIKLDAEPILKDLLFFIISVIGLIFTVKDNSVDIVKVGQHCGQSSQHMTDEGNASEDNNNNDNENVCKNFEANEENSDDLFDNKYVNTLLMPFNVMFDITMPSKMSSLKKFFISIAWLSTLSYFSVISITDFSETLGIPHTIAGMTVLAAGSAVPDLVTAVVVIRKTGKASVGISSAISANIFAILVGLGLPWLIKCSLNGYSTSIPSFVIHSESLPLTSCLLLVTIFALIFALKISEWQLFNKLAYLCGSIHVVFFCFTLVIEYLV
ncbi:unnamed protein product [Oppiella nova]|uniref:Sodium/calcium exchanger membrane region domain-containing protein n=1 Tax=Oppiella nova TaxID=334625 RepID=A0A7R9LQM1_9ACAR|nr:unnamed protein product [Oppiella nova]CAG2166016.1 unnamed protein product [Oppiella nova]